MDVTQQRKTVEILHQLAFQFTLDQRERKSSHVLSSGRQEHARSDQTE